MLTLNQYQEKYPSSIPNSILQKAKTHFGQKLKELELPSSLESNLEQVYIPLYEYLIKYHLQTRTSLILGICGAQGSGKTTFTQLLKLVLEKIFNLKVVSFSIDDFYLTRTERIELSEKIHPLLITRGVPGTHDVKMGINLIQKLKSNFRNENIAIPAFDKAIDDRYPESSWKTFNTVPDIILFEGWCVGARPQSEEELNQSVNKLEEQSDVDASYRNFVNHALAAEYQDWFALIDKLIMLRIPSFDKVYEWRLLQEEKLAKSSGKKKVIMNKEEIIGFISHFERLSRHMLQEMPARADVVFEINNDHEISGIQLKENKAKP